VLTQVFAADWTLLDASAWHRQMHSDIVWNYTHISFLQSNSVTWSFCWFGHGFLNNLIEVVREWCNCWELNSQFDASATVPLKYNKLKLKA